MVHSVHCSWLPLSGQLDSLAHSLRKRTLLLNDLTLAYLSGRHGHKGFLDQALLKWATLQALSDWATKEDFPEAHCLCTLLVIS